MKRAIPLKREFTEKPSKSIPKTVIKLAVALEPREESYANIQFDKSAESEYKNGPSISERLHSLRCIV